MFVYASRRFVRDGLSEEEGAPDNTEALEAWAPASEQQHEPPRVGQLCFDQLTQRLDHNQSTKPVLLRSPLPIPLRFAL